MSDFGAAIASPTAQNAARRLQALGGDILLSPRDNLLPTWDDSPCLPVVAGSGNWVALQIAPDCASEQLRDRPRVKAYRSCAAD